MSVDKIKAKILSDAQAEVQKIEAEIAQKVKKIQAEQGESVAAINKEAEEEGRWRAKDRLKKDLASAELELRKDLLEQKQKLIQKVFDKTLKHLARLKGEQYEKLIADLLLKTVQVGDEQVIFFSGDGHKLRDEFLEEVNSRLVKEGKKGALRLIREDRDMLGGFVLRRGKREVNCSIKALISTVREDLEPVVAKILFS